MGAQAAETWFYRLERSSVAEVAPKLLEMARGRGWRCLLVSPHDERLADLDDRLWTYRDDSFLAHGRADAPDPERQPVLLATSAENRLNAAELVILLDAAPAPRQLDGVARIIVLFDASQPQSLAAAREHWKGLARAGAAASYWVEAEDGKWVKER